MQGSVVQPFCYDESHPYDAGQHRGIDIDAGAAGETVVAPAAGTVSFAGTVPTSGKVVTIETADGYSVTLTHLGSIVVGEKATVTEGEAVGTIGPSGTPEVDGAYVHLGIRVTADELGYVDPLSLLPPATAAGGSDSGASGTQPVASGGASSSTAPTTQPSTPVAATAPATGAPGTIVQATPTRVAPYSRTRPARADTRSKSSPHRPSLAPPATVAPRIQQRRPVPHRRVSEPMSVSRRPVFAGAVPAESSGLAIRREPAPSVRHAAGGAPRQEASSPAPVLALACNGAAAIVAVAAALAAARRRRRAPRHELGAAEVIRLPHLRREPGARHAA